MNQPPGNLNDQIGQLTYRPERMAIHWLDELGAAHVPSASQGRVLGFIGDDGAVELANIVEGLAGKARMRLRPGLGSSSEPHALARSAAEAKPSLEIALVDAQPVVWYRSLATVSYVLEHLDGSATTRIRRIEEFGRPSAGRPARSRPSPWFRGRSALAEPLRPMRAEILAVASGDGGHGKHAYFCDLSRAVSRLRPAAGAMT